MNRVDVLLWIWFGLTGVSTAYLAYDLFTRTPAMKVMKWGWLLVSLYTGPFALVLYWFSCREPAPGTHEKFVAPLWKQAVGSTIHCLAGDATGVIVAASITSLLSLSMRSDSIVEYISGFTFGLFIFQSLFMKDMLGGSYLHAVRATWLPEWLSMNGVMAGMIPTMVILMSRDMRAMGPTSVRFWGTMSLATLVGAVIAYPINWWMVKNGLKHGMGTERALGKGGAKVSPEKMNMAMPMSASGSRSPMADHQQSKHAQTSSGAMANMSGSHAGQVSPARLVVVSLLSVALLAGGITVAANVGDFSMGSNKRMSMKQ